jgi:dienelactone hydrolase
VVNKQIDINSHGKTITTAVFPAAGASAGRAVVVAHGTDAMQDPWAPMIRQYATSLAQMGITALIPNYFEKTGTAPGMQVWSSPPSHLDAWVEAVGDTIAYARTLPGAPASRVGLLGFSLGGHICLRLRGSAQCVVEFFAPELRQFGGLDAAATAAGVQIHHGLADALVPFREAEAIAALLKKEGAAAELFSYEGAGHGFAGADPNNANARRSSKNRTLAFFQHSM